MHKSLSLKIFHKPLYFCLLALSLASSACAEADGRIPSVTSQNGVTVTVISETPVISAADPTHATTVGSLPNDPNATPVIDTARSGYTASGTENTTDTPSPDSGDLWQRIRNGFALKPLDSPLVATHVDWYAQRPDYLRRTIARSKMYLFHIMEEVQKRGMPAEIALLPIVESALQSDGLFA